MTLVADRFVVDRENNAVDLATGLRVVLQVSSAGGVAEQARWTERCARLAALRHQAMSVLIDYGPLGEARRFEAWRADDTLSVESANGAWAYERTAAFLTANALTSGVADLLVSADGRAVCVPGVTAGYETPCTSPESESTQVWQDLAGVALLPRAATSVLEELLSASKPHSRVVSLWGAPGAGTTTVVMEAARLARLHGFVPVSTRMVNADTLPLLQGRSTLVVACDDPAEGWRVFVGLAVYSPRAHLLLSVGASEARGMLPLVLEPLSEQALIGALRPSPVTAADRQRTAAAARKARGLPGRFASALWGEVHAPSVGALRAFRVAEQAAEYGAPALGHPRSRPVRVPPPTPVPVLTPLPATPSLWQSDSGLAVLRARRHTAFALLEAGKHASGERLLRQAIGGLARRDDWLQAAEGALTLADALASRGRSRDTETAVEQARMFAERAGSVELMLRAALIVGRLSTDMLHLDAAEAVLRAARATARGVGNRGVLRTAGLELSRCLFWRGRYEEAGSALSGCEEDPLVGDEAVAVAVARSRLALGLDDLPGAVACAGAAVSAAGGARPGVAALAWSAAAHAHLAVGDHPAVARDVVMALREARRAHDPLRAISVRLLRAESDRRQGQRAACARVVARLARGNTRRLPPLLLARVTLLADLLKDDGPVVVRRHASATGLGALALFAPVRRPLPLGQTLAADLVEILRCCQLADEEARVLGALCAQVRRATRATAVGVFVVEAPRLSLVASDGGRLDVDGAARVQLVGDLTGPRDGEASSEGGVPVRYGGQTIGVLAVRWSASGEWQGRDWRAILSAAAVAAAPVLAAEQSRRLRPPAGCAELIGTSEAMTRVRQAIERAAPAPFAVLVEGESGTGKELVARALHRRSPRRDRPCCTVNCAALPDDLLESELFGHARGAFTGAMAERPGVFEEAHSGTLFLDEIGELSLRAQAKVLRAIQEGEIRRVGENVARKVDLRIVAATNRDLRQEVAAGRFRLDLLYRLDVIRMPLPSLRDRVEDIPLLAEHFWQEATLRLGSRASLGAATLAALARYDWPGNVRELQNVLAALAVRCPRRGVVAPEALPSLFDAVRPDRSWRLDDARRTFESSFVRAALARAGGHRSRAAEELGLTRQGLTKLIARLGVAPAQLDH